MAGKDCPRVDCTLHVTHWTWAETWSHHGARQCVSFPGLGYFFNPFSPQVSSCASTSLLSSRLTDPLLLYPPPHSPDRHPPFPPCTVTNLSPLDTPPLLPLPVESVIRYENSTPQFVLNLFLSPLVFITICLVQAVPPLHQTTGVTFSLLVGPCGFLQSCPFPGVHEAMPRSGFKPFSDSSQQMGPFYSLPIVALNKLLRIWCLR